MGCETDALVPDCITNIQSDTIILSKTDIYGQEEQLNKGIFKKSSTANFASKLCLHQKNIASLGELSTDRGFVNDARIAS